MALKHLEKVMHGPDNLVTYELDSAWTLSTNSMTAIAEFLDGIDIAPFDMIQISLVCKTDEVDVNIHFSNDATFGYYQTVVALTGMASGASGAIMKTVILSRHAVSTRAAATHTWRIEAGYRYMRIDIASADANNHGEIMAQITGYLRRGN